ncbi:hypothetical protein NHX12_013802 [Muraenolepis orangiensis]|uniref:DUF4371 domain-containing protein n=1 Tax=Muraenolepis orangiensis TaxID=630683 RepID=A0A9Q0DDM8_9TELE|nr:hypothetical protein NHX12_013802 [Muraenolepis orangiensis]
MHLKATIIMKTFGDCQVTLLDEQGRRDAIVHNEKVKRNRDILRRLIHCVVFLGKQELPFRGHDEGRGSTNRGNYLELLSFLAEYDLDLHHHLTTSSVFSGTSAHIQNDLICAVADVMGETIKEELRTTPFVALMLDETSDFGNTAQLSLVLRFVGDGGVKERFITFAEVTGSGRAEGVAAVALGLLEEYGCVDKLVAQCYDGAVAMASGLNEAQARVKERIPQALFVHCYAHALPLVLSQGAAKIKECKIFFSHLSGLGVYFSRSPERTKLLGDMCQKRLVPTGGNFSSKLVCTVFEKKESLKDVFDHIVEHHEDFDEAAVHGADGHMSNLGSFEFNFLLSTFNEIFAHADVLFEHLQKNSFDTKFCMDKVDTFCVSVEGQRERFDGTYDETVQNTGVTTIDECQTDIPAILHFETNPNAPKRSIARKPDGSKPAKLRRQRLSALECSDGPGLPTADQNTNSARVTVEEVKVEEDKEVTVEEVTVEEEVKVEEDKKGTVEEVTVKVEDAEVTEEEEEDRGGREGIEEPIEEPWSASPEMPSPAPGVLLPGATVLKEADRFTFTSGCTIGRVGFQSPLDQNATLVVSLVRHQVDISTGKE